MLARGNENFRAPGEHGFSFFQVKIFTGSVSVLLTSISLKKKKYMKFTCFGTLGGPNMDALRVDATIGNQAFSHDVIYSLDLVTITQLLRF